MSVEALRTILLTALPSAAAAASRFIVPMTLSSCRRRLLVRVESTSRCVWSTVSTCVARTMRRRIAYDASAFTNSVRVSGRRGSRVSTPTTSSTSGRCSSASAMRLPQNVPRPVTRTRTGSTPPDAAPVAQQVVDLRLDERADPLRLLHHHAAVVAGEPGLHVEGDRREHTDAELRRQRQHVAEHRSVHELVGGDREVGKAEELGDPRALPEDGHGLLVADDR